jgi:hypothetical protein
MDTISQLQQDIERYDADALYYNGRAEHCRHEAALLRQELAQEQSRKGLEDAHALAATIVELDGLTGAERETAERVMCGLLSHAVHSLTSAALACTSAARTKEGKQKPINIV